MKPERTELRNDFNRRERARKKSEKKKNNERRTRNEIVWTTLIPLKIAQQMIRSECKTKIKWKIEMYLGKITIERKKEKLFALQLQTKIYSVERRSGLAIFQKKT